RYIHTYRITLQERIVIAIPRVAVGPVTLGVQDDISAADTLGIDVLCNLEHRRVRPDIIAGNIEPDSRQMSTLNQTRRQVIADLYILQPDISCILQVFGLRSVELARAVLRLITTQPGEIGIGIVVRPLFANLVLRILVVRPIVLPPEYVGLTAGPPVALGDTLEERADKEVIPVGGKIETKRITGQRITDDPAVTRVALRIGALVDDAVGVKIFELDITRPPDIIR